jgi:hypothetical protein
MATLVINVSRVPQNVGLILANGKKAYSRIMQRSRAEIAPGVTVDPHWLAMNPGVVKVSEVQPKPVKQAKTNSSKPKVVVQQKTTAGTTDLSAETVTPKGAE